MTYEKELEEYLSENTNGWDTQRAHMLNEWEGEGLELDGHKLEYVEHTGLRGGGDGVTYDIIFKYRDQHYAFMMERNSWDSDRCLGFVRPVEQVEVTNMVWVNA